MVEKTQKKLVQEVHQAMFGVEGTDDKGLVGDIKEIKLNDKEKNKKIQNNSNAISKIKGYLVGASILGATGTGFGLSQLLGG